MSKQRINTIKKIISKIDILLLQELDNEEFNDDKISTLSGLKQEYRSELSNLIKSNNTVEMFKNDKYKKLP